MPTLLNVENVELLSPTSDATIDFTGKTTGLQEVTIEGVSSTLAALTVKGLSGITLGVEGATLNAGAIATTTITTLTADFGSTTTSANLSIKDAAVTTADLSTGNAALTTLNIAADGLGENSIGLKLPAATTTLKITGAGTLDLGTTPTTVSTIDASANTGGVDVTVGAVNATFTGGSGNDTFSSALADFDANDKLDGGTGTTDTLILTGLTSTPLTTAQYAAIKAVNNFEVLNLSGTDITVDASQLPANANDIFTLTTPGTLATPATIAVTNATASNTFTLAGTGSNLAGNTANSFDITGTGAANIALQDNATIDALNLTGVTTLNIQSEKQELTTASNSITLGTGLGTATTSTVAIKVTGDSALTIAQPTTSINVNIDATGFKGALTATGGGGDGGTPGTVSTNILTGGDGNDTLTGGGAGTTNTLIGGAGTNRLVAGSGTDVLTGGLGTDTFVFSIAASNAGSFTGGATDTFDTVNSFAQGTDKIELSGNVFSATDLVSQSTVQTAVGNATTLSAALPNAAAAIGAGKFGAFVLGSATYILGNDAIVGTLDKNDLLIKLASTTTLAAGDFTFSPSA
ncbi:beta strand repeat-containing protein [Nostoc sp.]|uniref:beta strand repeat-containing protein n=1 Tax=Nostoc sp. TaxID=1180 RepID=UPI003FA55CAF